MEHTLPTERTVVVRYDPDQAAALAYHRDRDTGRLVVTFGAKPPTVDHLAMVLRREVEPPTSGAFPDAVLDADTDTDLARLEADQQAGDYRRNSPEPRALPGDHDCR